MVFSKAFLGDFWPFCFASLFFMLPQVGKQPVLGSTTQTQVSDTFPSGQCPHTRMQEHMHTHTVNPKSKQYFLLVSWIPVVRFVSVAPGPHRPALGNPGDDRRMTQFCSRELCMCVCPVSQAHICTSGESSVKVLMKQLIK